MAIVTPAGPGSARLLPELAAQVDRLIALPGDANPGAGAPLQCIQSLTGAVAGDSLMCLGIEDAMWVLQGGGMARFGHGLCTGPVGARSVNATNRAIRNTRGYRTDALVTLKANRRTLHWQDVHDVIDALGKDGTWDDTEADGHFVMGTAYDESLRDGEVPVGIVALQVEG